MEIIDLSRIKETSDGDKTFEKELIEMYLEDAKELIHKIEEAYVQQNFENLRRYAHTLKGSSANIGADAMRQGALNVELSGGGDGSVIKDLSQRLEETRKAYMAYLSSS